MTKAALENYHVRMQRVLDHIDQHLDDDLGLERLSGLAAFSKHHFHPPSQSLNHTGAALGILLWVPALEKEATRMYLEAVSER